MFFKKTDPLYSYALDIAPKDLYFSNYKIEMRDRNDVETGIRFLVGHRPPYVSGQTYSYATLFAYGLRRDGTWTKLNHFVTKAGETSDMTKYDNIMIATIIKLLNTERNKMTSEKLACYEEAIKFLNNKTE